MPLSLSNTKWAIGMIIVPVTVGILGIVAGNITSDISHIVEIEFYNSMDEQQAERIKTHLGISLSNVVLLTEDLSERVESIYKNDADESVEKTLELLRDTDFFPNNPRAPHDVKYIYILDTNCIFVSYAYIDSINRLDARGLQSCDDLSKLSKDSKNLQKEFRKITDNYASTGKVDYVNSIATPLDLDKNGKTDLILGVGIDWDSISKEIKNLIYLDGFRYMIKDESGVVVVNVTSSEINFLSKQAKNNLECGIPVVSNFTTSDEVLSLSDVCKNPDEILLLPANSTANLYKPLKNDHKPISLEGVLDLGKRNGEDMLQHWELIIRPEK